MQSAQYLIMTNTSGTSLYTPCIFLIIILEYTPTEKKKKGARHGGTYL